MEPDLPEEWRAVEMHARADQITREFELSHAEFEQAMRLYAPYGVRGQSARVSRREELINHLRRGWNYDRVVNDPVNLRAVLEPITINEPRVTVERIRPSGQDEIDAIEIIRCWIADSSIPDHDEAWCRQYWEYDIETDRYVIRVGGSASVIPRHLIHSPIAGSIPTERNQEMAFVGAMEPEKKFNPCALHYCSCWAEDKQFPPTKPVGFLLQCLKCGGQMNGKYREYEGRATGWINQTAAQRLGLPLLDVAHPTQQHEHDPETTLQLVRIDMEDTESNAQEQPF